MHTLCLLLCITIAISSANDDLFILIDEISVYNCRGVKNEILVSEEDVQIVNEYGNRVYYIRAPGNYSISFNKIKVQKNFGYLAGEIGVTLQVPIIEGPAGIRFDLPYTMIPETGLLSQKCDDYSGIVERNGRTYCRYCDLCQVSEAVEKELSSGRHQFLSSNPVSKCHNIEANEYDFQRTIQLPSRSTLEQMIRSKAQGVDDEIKKRLNKGRGRFQVFLNLIAAEKPAISKSRWFAGSKDCECCFNKNAANCDTLSYFYCNMEDCKTGWALQCLHNSARVAACYTVEFNYRMTTSYADVLQFLRENNYSNVENHQGSVSSFNQSPRRPVSSTTPSPVTQSVEHRQINQVQMSRVCVEAMSPKLTHLRRYCTIFWNEKLCCEHCPDIC